jgi:hypothetical protein
MVQTVTRTISALAPLLDLLPTAIRRFAVSLLDRIPGLTVPGDDLRRSLSLVWLCDEASRMGCPGRFTHGEFDILAVSVWNGFFWPGNQPREAQADDTDTNIPPNLPPTEAAAIFLRLLSPLSPLLWDAHAARGSSTILAPSAVATAAEGLRGVLVEQLDRAVEALRLFGAKPNQQTLLPSLKRLMRSKQTLAALANDLFALPIVTRTVRVKYTGLLAAENEL